MFIHVNGVRLFYEKQGTGKPLILLHGNEEDHRIFDEAIELLKKHYTVYAVDSRGHGQSDKVLEYHYPVSYTHLLRYGIRRSSIFK